MKNWYPAAALKFCRGIFFLSIIKNNFKKFLKSANSGIICISWYFYINKSTNKEFIFFGIQSLNGYKFVNQDSVSYGNVCFKYRDVKCAAQKWKEDCMKEIL